MKLRMTWENGRTSNTTLKSFCLDNSEEPSLCRKAKRLRPGGSFHAGGGAGPYVKVSRIKTRRKKR